MIISIVFFSEGISFFAVMLVLLSRYLIGIFGTGGDTYFVLLLLPFWFLFFVSLVPIESEALFLSLFSLLQLQRTSIFLLGERKYKGGFQICK